MSPEQEKIPGNLSHDQKIFQKSMEQKTLQDLCQLIRKYSKIYIIQSARMFSSHQQKTIDLYILPINHPIICWFGQLSWFVTIWASMYACLHSVQLGFQTSLHHQLWGVENWRKYKISICMSWTKQICGLYQPIPLKPTKLIRLVGGSLNLTHVTVPFALKPQLYASTVSNCKTSLFSLNW